MEAHFQRFVHQQATDERLARTEHELDGLGRLHGAEHAGQHAEHAGVCAIGHESLGTSAYRQR